MAKKKKGLETTFAHWAYDNRKTDSKMYHVMQRVNELQQTLGEKKKK